MEEREEEEMKGFEEKGNNREAVPAHWVEILEPERLFKKKEEKKTRRPMKITRWFGDEDSISEESSSGSEEEWTGVQRVKKNKENIKKSKEKKKMKMRQTVMKAHNMLGVGKINR